MRVVTPLAWQSVAPLRQTPVSKSLLCAYLHVLPRLRRINAKVRALNADTLTRRYTRGKRHDQNPRVHEAISQPVSRRHCACTHYWTRFRPNKVDQH